MVEHEAGFRALLVADLALGRGVAPACEVAMALQRFWEDPNGDFPAALMRLAGVAEADLQPVLDEVERLVSDSGGDARTALGRRGGLDRSIPAALGFAGAALTQALARLGAPVRAPLRLLPTERYVEFEPVGEGGMGVVYLALDTELNRKVAFKIVQPDPSAAATGEGATPAAPTEALPPPRNSAAAQEFEELKTRFLQEAWVTGALEHPGIVPVYELGETPKGVPYYTMRLIHGRRTLADAIGELRSGPPEERLALIEPFLKLCDTVRYAHAKGILHRDLKPANVALGEFGEVVLLDWGLAKSESRKETAQSLLQQRIEELRTATGMETVASALGTPGYMAPEAALGHMEEVDRRSDIYSLGAILFEILTGRRPIVFETFAEWMAQLATQDPPAAGSLEPDVPQALSDLCARALSREKELRPESVEALEAEVRAWQVQSAVEKEIEGLLRDARAALDAAEEVSGEARLKQVDRAAGALQRVTTRQPENPAALRYQERATALREEGIRERERATGRRLLVRAGVVVLLLATVAGFVVAGVLDRRRREAAHERDAKARALRQVLRLADAKKVGDLLKEMDTLWPVHPRRAPAMAGWLGRARAVLANRAEHEAALATVRARGEKRTTWSFESAEDDWRHEVLTDLLAGLDRLKRAEKTITERHEAARTLARRSIEAHRKEWEETLRAIAAAPQYQGLHLVPQLGLVPLGPDPKSGLFEFAHLGSGTVPRRDPKTKRLLLAEDCGVVLVLIPGGTFLAGAQNRDKQAPNYDPWAERYESPVHAVTLHAFFLSKYECTQAQWLALSGLQPSRFGDGKELQEDEIAPRNPVERISWDDSTLWLRRNNLVLPTEAQWEYACRAGSDTPWSSGREITTLQGAANLADAFLKAHGGPESWSYDEELDDGFVTPAPVGSLAPNGFGLFDVHGNVWEWCRDSFTSYPDDAVTDPLAKGAGPRIHRGGSWNLGAAYARSANRSTDAASVRSDRLGVRPARAVASR